MEKSVKFIRISAIIFKVLAWISVAFFIIVALIVLFGGGGTDTPRAASIIFLLGGGLYFLILFSIAEAFKILISLSEKINGLGETSSGADITRDVQQLTNKVERILSLLEGKPK